MEKKIDNDYFCFTDISKKYKIIKENISLFKNQLVLLQIIDWYLMFTN